MNAKMEKAIRNASRQLEKSERGQQAKRDLLTMFENGALGLDSENQIAVQILLLAAMKGGMAGTVLEVLRETSAVAS